MNSVTPLNRHTYKLLNQSLEISRPFLPSPKKHTHTQTTETELRVFLSPQAHNAIHQTWLQMMSDSHDNLWSPPPQLHICSGILVHTWLAHSRLHAAPTTPTPTLSREVGNVWACSLSIFLVTDSEAKKQASPPFFFDVTETLEGEAESNGAPQCKKLWQRGEQPYTMQKALWWHTTAFTYIGVEVTPWEHSNDTKDVLSLWEERTFLLLLHYLQLEFWNRIKYRIMQK